MPVAVVLEEVQMLCLLLEVMCRTFVTADRSGTPSTAPCFNLQVQFIRLLVGIRMSGYQLPGSFYAKPKK